MSDVSLMYCNSLPASFFEATLFIPMTRQAFEFMYTKIEVGDVAIFFLNITLMWLTHIHRNEIVIIVVTHIKTLYKTTSV